MYKKIEIINISNFITINKIIIKMSCLSSSVKSDYVTIEDLFQKDFEINGNVNISIMGLLTNQNVICFGGSPRDMIAGKRSSDVDLLYKTDYTHKFDGNNFIDVFQDKIKSIFEFYGLDATIDKTEIVSLGCKTGYFDTKYTKNQNCEDDNFEENINLDEYNNFNKISDDKLLDMIMFPEITPGHCTYTLTIKDCINNKYTTILDITFHKGNSEVCPAVEEDSLQTFLPLGKFVELLSTSTNALEALDKIKNCLIENSTSMIPHKNSSKIISNLKTGKVTIYDIDQVKRIIKLGKLVYRGYEIIKIDENLRSRVMELKSTIRSNKEELTDEQQTYFNYLYSKI